MQFIWTLLEDFMEQSLVMKFFLAWGWASIWIMILGLVFVTKWSELGL